MAAVSVNLLIDPLEFWLYYNTTQHLEADKDSNCYPGQKASYELSSHSNYKTFFENHIWPLKRPG